jgi:hypothetical protein
VRRLFGFFVCMLTTTGTSFPLQTQLRPAPNTSSSSSGTYVRVLLILLRPPDDRLSSTLLRADLRSRSYSRLFTHNDWCACPSPATPYYAVVRPFAFPAPCAPHATQTRLMATSSAVHSVGVLSWRTSASLVHFLAAISGYEGCRGRFHLVWLRAPDSRLCCSEDCREWT